MNAKLALLISTLAISPAALAVSQSGVLPDDWYLRLIPQQDRSGETVAPESLPTTKVVRANPPKADAPPDRTDTTRTRDQAAVIIRPSENGRESLEPDKQVVLEDWKRASLTATPVDDLPRSDTPLLVESKHSSAANTDVSRHTPQKKLPRPGEAALTAKSVLKRQMKELEELVVSATETVKETPVQRRVDPKIPGDVRDAGRQDLPPKRASTASTLRADPAAPEETTPVLEQAEPQEKRVASHSPKRAAPPKTATVSVDLPAAQTVPDETADPVRLAGGNRQTATAIPVPIQFIYRQAAFTPSGDAAADLLLEYVMSKRPASITLSGHADERASSDYNMDLSRRRLQSVAAFLRNGGYKGKLILQSLGESQPYTGVDRSQYPLDELYQLDRRVELHLGGFRYGELGASGSDGS